MKKFLTLSLGIVVAFLWVMPARAENGPSAVVAKVNGDSLVLTAYSTAVQLPVHYYKYGSSSQDATSNGWVADGLGNMVFAISDTIESLSVDTIQSIAIDASASGWVYTNSNWLVRRTLTVSIETGDITKLWYYHGLPVTVSVFSSYTMSEVQLNNWTDAGGGLLTMILPKGFDSFQVMGGPKPVFDSFSAGWWTYDFVHYGGQIVEKSVWVTTYQGVSTLTYFDPTADLSKLTLHYYMYGDPTEHTLADANLWTVSPFAVEMNIPANWVSVQLLATPPVLIDFSAASSWKMGGDSHWVERKPVLPPAPVFNHFIYFPLLSR